MSDIYTGTKTIELSVSKNLAGSGATESLNLFQLTGSVKVKKLYGVVTAKTTLTNMTDAHFNLYDSTSSVALTKATTLTMSTAIVGSVVYKTAAAATAASFLAGSVGGVIEPGQAQEDFETIVVQKSGANTYIRWTYTTTDAPIAATMKFYIEYEGINGGYLSVI